METRDSSLGIRRGIVHLAEHDPAWIALGRDLVAHLAEALDLPPARVQHGGSTSIRGLVAKPILDVVLGLEQHESTDAIARRLVALGYIDRGDGRGSIGRLLVRESEPEVRTIHVHVVGHASSAWRDYVAFRDALRIHEELRDEYGRLKRSLAARFPDDRSAYRRAKDELIGGVIASLSTDVESGPGP